MTIRCLLVDDSRHFLRAAGDLLEQGGISVVGMASNGTEAVRRAEELRPELVLLDVCLGGDCGLELAELLTEIARDSPSGGWRPAIILTSIYAEDDYADLVAGSAAIGFLGKSALSVSAIKDILRAGSAGLSVRS